MGFNRRKMEDQRRQAAVKEAAARRATEAQVLEDAERLIDAWNERQAKRMPMLFSPTIGAGVVSQFEFIDPLTASSLTNCCMLTGSALGIFMGSNGSEVRMSVRILDDSGGEIASVFSEKPEGDEGGFSASLRDALLAFRKKYPKTRFIDVEFKGIN
jgi:hypothetical protein